jgi:hypothetical protein
MGHLNSCPREIVLEICQQLCWHCRSLSSSQLECLYEIDTVGRSTLASLCLTSKSLCRAVQPVLFHQFTSNSKSPLHKCLETFTLRPDLAGSVVSLHGISTIALFEGPSALKDVIATRSMSTWSKTIFHEIRNSAVVRPEFPQYDDDYQSSHTIINAFCQLLSLTHRATFLEIDVDNLGSILGSKNILQEDEDLYQQPQREAERCKRFVCPSVRTLVLVCHETHSRLLMPRIMLRLANLLPNIETIIFREIAGFQGLSSSIARGGPLGWSLWFRMGEPVFPVKTSRLHLDGHVLDQPREFFLGETRDRRLPALKHFKWTSRDPRNPETIVRLLACYYTAQIESLHLDGVSQRLDLLQSAIINLHNLQILSLPLAELIEASRGHTAPIFPCSLQRLRILKCTRLLHLPLNLMVRVQGMEYIQI